MKRASTIRGTLKKAMVPLKIAVDGYVTESGFLGVHRNQYGTRKSAWGVTHIPTGHLISTAKTRNVAFAAAVLIDDLDWNFSDPLHARSMRDEVIRRLKQMGIDVATKAEP